MPILLQDNTKNSLWSHIQQAQCHVLGIYLQLYWKNFAKAIIIIIMHDKINTIAVYCIDQRTNSILECNKRMSFMKHEELLGVFIHWTGLLHSPIFHKKHAIKTTQSTEVMYPGRLVDPSNALSLTRGWSLACVITPYRLQYYRAATFIASFYSSLSLIYNS